MDLFLIILAGIWLITASLQDLRKREVANWLSFSLIAFALAYRAFYSVFNNNPAYILFGLFGLGVFIILGYMLYYGRIFAGGDAKLLMGLGAVLPVSSSISGNLMIFLSFIFLFLICGSVYGATWSLVLTYGYKEKFAKEFSKQFRKNIKIFYIAIAAAILLGVFALFIKEYIFLLLPLIIAILPFLLVYARSVEESCMIVEIPGNKVTVGDWLYQQVKVRGKIIKPYWEGLSEKEVDLLKNAKKVKIKQGIPFVPVFFIAFLLFLFLRYSDWSFFQLF